MKTALALLLVCFSSAVIISCSNNESRNSTTEGKPGRKSEINSDRNSGLVASKSEIDNSENGNIGSFSWSVSDSHELKTEDRKFIRQADIRFQVGDVVKCSDDIESIVDKSGGFIASTRLNNDLQNKTRTVISKDSALYQYTYSVTNKFILRVPDTKLDTVIKSLMPLIGHLDYRLITSDDVTLEVLSRERNRIRAKKDADRLMGYINDKDNSGKDKFRYDEKITERNANYEAYLIEQKKLMDQVRFSTINLEIYQDDFTFSKTEVIPVQIKPYQPGFFNEIKDSLAVGWQVIMTLLLFIAKIWSLLILAFIAFVIIRIRKIRQGAHV